MKRQSGMTLVQVLVSVAVAGILATGISQFMSNINRSAKNAQAFGERDRIKDKIHRALLKRDTLVASLDDPMNADLKRCTNKGAQCVSYTGTGTTKSYVYYPMVIRSPFGAEVLAGTKALPAFYSLDGELCAKADVKCPFKAYSEFRAYCLDNAANCQEASGFEIVFYIEDGSNVRAGQTTLSAKAEPKAPLSVSANNYFKLADFVEPSKDPGKAPSCPAGQIRIDNVCFTQSCVLPPSSTVGAPTPTPSAPSAGLPPGGSTNPTSPTTTNPRSPTTTNPRSPTRTDPWGNTGGVW